MIHFFGNTNSKVFAVQTTEELSKEDKKLIIREYNKLPEKLRYNFIRKLYLSRGRYIKEFVGFIPSFYELCEQYYSLNSNIDEWRSICINDFYFSNEGKKIFTYKVKDIIHICYSYYNKINKLKQASYFVENQVL